MSIATSLKAIALILLAFSAYTGLYVNLLPENEYSVTLNFPDPESDVQANPEHAARV